MPSPSRVSLHASTEIAAPADRVWELIRDWAGMLRWWLPADRGGLRGAQLIGCELLGTPGSVPRTRRMLLGDGSTVDETVVYQNDETRRIHYLKADEETITGYAATTHVDELPQGGCAVHVSSSFDVRSPADRASAMARFEAVYAAMLRAYREYFSDRARDVPADPGTPWSVPSVVIVTGMQAAGKTTVGRLLAQALPRAAFIDGDVLARMVLSGREGMTPTPSEEAVRQLHLRYAQAATLADSFHRAGDHRGVGGQPVRTGPGRAAGPPRGPARDRRRPRAQRRSRDPARVGSRKQGLRRLDGGRRARGGGGAVPRLSRRDAVRRAVARQQRTDCGGDGRSGAQ